MYTISEVAFTEVRCGLLWKFGIHNSWEATLVDYLPTYIPNSHNAERHYCEHILIYSSNLCYL